MSGAEAQALLLAGMPRNRLIDLGTRAEAGALTDIEKLALSVLRGGSAGEEATPALLDEALATYAHGSYRVPVRVVGDSKRMKIVVTADPFPDDDNQKMAFCDMIRRAFQEMKIPLIMLPVGWKLDVYEVAAPDEAGVTFEPS